MRRTTILGMLTAVLALAAPAFANPPGGTELRNQAHHVSWSGVLVRSGAPSGAVPECAAVPCSRFDLTVDLPPRLWKQRAGGVEVSIRWTSPNANLKLFVYHGGSLVASSAGIIAISQSVLLDSAANGRYSVYVAFDSDFPDDVVPFEAVAEVEYAPKPFPERRLLPDLEVRPHTNVTFDTPPPIFFEPTPLPGHSCFPTEELEDGARRCLRFDQILANTGEGALELEFVIPHDAASPNRSILQRIGWSDDPARVDAVPADEWEFHEAHGHYHYTGFAVGRLWPTLPSGARAGAAPLRTGQKVSFCLADIVVDAWAEKGNAPRRYFAPDCLFPVSSDAANDYLIQGIGPGWADIYDWFLPDQYIEVTGVPDGIYVLDTIADPENTLIEADETNNCGSLRIRLSDTATASPRAQVLGVGPPC